MTNLRPRAAELLRLFLVPNDPEVYPFQRYDGDPDEFLTRRDRQERVSQQELRVYSRAFSNLIPMYRRYLTRWIGDTPLNQVQKLGILTLYRQLVTASQASILSCYDLARFGVDEQEKAEDVLQSLWHGVNELVTFLFKFHRDSDDDILRGSIKLAGTIVGILLTEAIRLSSASPPMASKHRIMLMEILGDLSRYLIVADKEDWRDVAHTWFLWVSDEIPTTGRIHHHLAITSRRWLRKGFYLVKSLCVATQFEKSPESIEMILENPPNGTSPAELAFLKVHSITAGIIEGDLDKEMDGFISQLGPYIESSWPEPGYEVAIMTCCSILGYSNSAQLQDLTEMTKDAIRLGNLIHCVVLERAGDPKVFPYFHVFLVFLCFSPGAMDHPDLGIPKGLVVNMLNRMLGSYTKDLLHLKMERFPRPEGRGSQRPFPDDYGLRGLAWTENYYPKDWFSCTFDIAEKHPGVADEEYVERVLWIAFRMVNRASWLGYSGSFIL
ncbi:hypothetical protein B0T14DRAFT_563007 [Immersiella caudata]|uniref:Uncharacterized protein n=1 Tax=Immersiella caudata TaxID=314043 RepID=A0AA39X4K6_9PEZI|nr:hypothetical protein B0T14DRAFT_563007 [Immersiella caudata]